MELRSLTIVAAKNRHLLSWVKASHARRPTTARPSPLQLKYAGCWPMFHQTVWLVPCKLRRPQWKHTTPTRQNLSPHQPTKHTLEMSEQVQPSTVQPPKGDDQNSMAIHHQNHPDKKEHREESFAKCTVNTVQRGVNISPFVIIMSRQPYGCHTMYTDKCVSCLRHDTSCMGAHCA